MGGENRGWALSSKRDILLYREIGNKTEKWVRKKGEGKGVEKITKQVQYKVQT